MSNNKINLNTLLRISEVVSKQFFSLNSSNFEQCRDQIFDHFIDLYSQNENLQHPESYYWKVARNQACTYYRRLNTQLFKSKKNLPTSSYSSEDSLVDQISLSILANTNDIDGEIINLLAEGYDRKEISEMLNIIPSTLNTKIHRNRGTKWKL